MSNPRRKPIKTIDRGYLNLRVGADGKLRARLEARTNIGSIHAPSPHLTARRDLHRYYDLIEKALWRVSLTESEASLIVDVLNGTIIEMHAASMLWAEIEDGIRLDGLDQKWKLEGLALVTKAKSWELAECMAICDAAERFWIGPYLNEKPMRERLLAVGLIREEKKK